MSTPSIPSTARFFTNFSEAFSSFVPLPLFKSIFAAHAPRGGGKAKISPYDFVMAQVFHAMAGFGTFAAHCFQLLQIKLSDNALSQRKLSFCWKLLEELLPALLAPLASQTLHPAAFHAGLRLLAFDGTKLRLRNTPDINTNAPKIPCSKGGGQPAFAHLLAVVLLELGTHAPLAALVGWKGEGELALARRLFGGIAECSLILADRLYGCPWFIWNLLPTLEKTCSKILMRVRSNITVKRLERLVDGSCLVIMPVIDPKTRRQVGKLTLREIQATITVEGSGQPTIIRLWTTLLDAEAHPAVTLVKLYAERWEHELFYRELKSHIHGANQLLHAQTTDTAAQEVYALMLAASLLARQRVAVASQAEVPVLRISLAMVLTQTIALYKVLECAKGIISVEQGVALARQMLEELAITAVMKPRKPRRCQRAVRQPVKDWPKMRHPTSMPLVSTIEIVGLLMKASHEGREGAEME